jgi:hypothetical protein
VSRGPTVLPVATGRARKAAAVSGGAMHSLSTPGHARSAARWSRALSPFLVALAMGALPAAAQEAPPPPPPPAVPAQPPPPRSPPRAQPTLTDEDREVVDNLELLESLDATEDLDVLMELSQKD